MRIAIFIVEITRILTNLYKILVIYIIMCSIITFITNILVVLIINYSYINIFFREFLSTL